MRISAASVEMNATAASERTRIVRQEARASIAPRARAAPRSEPAAAWLEQIDILEVEDIRSLIAKWLFRFFVGSDMETFDTGKFRAMLQKAVAGARGRMMRSGAGPTRGLSVSVNRQEVVIESESVVFRASGAVKTEDGRQLDFSLDLTMSSELTRVRSMTVRVSDQPTTDPLVLRFEPGEALLSDERMEFDLDLDGDPEHVARLAPGNAFLVHDRDANGMVTNAAELFGPATGDGFDELALHDADGNGWIDENDPVFDALAVWETSEELGDVLIPLREAGVGAIALKNLATPLSLYSSAGQFSGRVASTGVFLTESGEARAIHHVDLSG